MTASRLKLKSCRQNDQGFVAIITAVVVCIILSVITMTFVVITLRESRQALDKQLSSQAFYAAESGLNYAIRQQLTSNQCASPGYAFLDAGSTKQTKYTCILTDDTPTQVVYDKISLDNPTVFFISNKDNTASPLILDSIDINWGNSSQLGKGQPAGQPDAKFYPTSTWGGAIGVLEVSIYPIDDPIDSTKLKTNGRTFYLYPEEDGGGTSASFNDIDAKILKGKCSDVIQNANGGRRCNGVHITGFACAFGVASCPGEPSQSPPVPASDKTGYIIRLRSIYNPVSLQITGAGVDPTSKKCSSGLCIFHLVGGQKTVDVTGKAGDVLRRIQVRVPTHPSFEWPVFGIETADNLCKQLEVWPGGATDNCS